MKNILILGLVLVLAGCGGVHKFKKSGSKSRVSTPATQVVPVRARIASGPISQACMASDRKARSRQLCGCIQAVADTTLSGNQQRRAATFYSDPQKAQDVKMSDRESNEKFWDDYKAYSKRAQQTCRA